MNYSYISHTKWKKKSVINVCGLYMQILHVSEVEVRETKLMGDTPIIIVAVRLRFYPLPFQE